jgi:hypothetical protein
MNQRASRPSGMTALSQENGVKPGPRFLLAGMSRAATVGIFVLMVFAALYWAQPVLMPVILALVAGVVLTPVLLLAARFGVPHWLTSLILVSSIFVGSVLCGRAACGPDRRMDSEGAGIRRDPAGEAARF